jgi:hypothetical protein
VARDLAAARELNGDLERRLAVLEEAVARSKGLEESQAARAEALENALEAAVSTHAARRSMVKRVSKAGAKVLRCREELRDAEEKLGGALAAAQECFEEAAAGVAEEERAEQM